MRLRARCATPEMSVAISLLGLAGRIKKLWPIATDPTRSDKGCLGLCGLSIGGAGMWTGANSRPVSFNFCFCVGFPLPAKAARSGSPFRFEFSGEWLVCSAGFLALRWSCPYRPGELGAGRERWDLHHPSGDVFGEHLAVRA